MISSYHKSEVTQSCPTLCDPMDCGLPGFSVHGIFQASVLEWGAISLSRGSSHPRDRTQVSCIVGRHFTLWASCHNQTLHRPWPHPRPHCLITGTSQTPPLCQVLHQPLPLQFFLGFLIQMGFFLTSTHTHPKPTDICRPAIFMKHSQTSINCSFSSPKIYIVWNLIMIAYGKWCRIRDLQRFSFGTRDKVWSLKSFCVTVLLKWKRTEKPSDTDIRRGTESAPSLVLARELIFLIDYYNKSKECLKIVKILIDPLPQFTF